MKLVDVDIFLDFMVHFHFFLCFSFLVMSFLFPFSLFSLYHVIFSVGLKGLALRGGALSRSVTQTWFSKHYVSDHMITYYVYSLEYWGN